MHVRTKLRNRICFLPRKVSVLYFPFLSAMRSLGGTEERTDRRMFSYGIYGFSYQKPLKELPRLSITSYIYGSNVGMESPQGKVSASLSFLRWKYEEYDDDDDDNGGGGRNLVSLWKSSFSGSKVAGARS